MKDNKFFEELDLGYRRHTNFKKCHDIQQGGGFAAIQRVEQYFCGDMNRIEEEVFKNMDFKLTKDNPIAHYIVYHNEISIQ